MGWREVPPPRFTRPYPNRTRCGAVCCGQRYGPVNILITTTLAFNHELPPPRTKRPH